MIWNIFKKNKLKSEEGKLRLGFEYFKEFLDSSLTEIKSTSNAANITIPYLELMDKINPDKCAGQVLDETTLPGERETLKNAFKWLLESENAHSSFNMSKQKYKQLILTHYLLISRFLPGVGEIPLGSLESHQMHDGKEEKELEALMNFENKFQELAKIERYKLFNEIEYYFPFPAGQEITSFGMDLVCRAASLGKYCLEDNFVEAGKHILKMIGLNLYGKFFSEVEQDKSLISDVKICFDLSLLSGTLFHEKQFESKKIPFRKKVDNAGGVYSARGSSFVAMISLCSHCIASKLNTHGENADPDKMSTSVTSLFFPFLKDADKDELIALGLKRAHDIYSSDPPNEWVPRISELTKNYCLSSSFKEDDNCINAMFEIFDDLFLINFRDWERSRLKTNLSRKHSIDEKSSDDEGQYNGEV